MSLVSAFLEENRGRLGLARYGVTGAMSCLLVTPGFATSRHVVALVAPEGESSPVLVAKIPRLAFDRAGLEAEAAALEELARRVAGGLDGAPRVVAFEDVHGRPVLVETAVNGHPLNPRKVRRDRTRAVELGLGFLDRLPRDGAASTHKEAFRRLLERPLLALAERAAGDPALTALVGRTLEITRPLEQAAFALVFEHGDVCHPNIVVRGDGRLGVVDWELADPRGLPLNDLCFMLAYVAGAGIAAGRLADHRRAFHDAFVVDRAWAAEIVSGFAARTGVQRRLLTPLFVAVWARYVARLAERADAPPGAIRCSRYCAFWEHAVEHASSLAWRVQ